jgi:predicted DNA-binding protein YlxM (UPF0122 family)
MKMNENNFKKKFKPAACTTQPWKYLIPKDVREDTLHKIRQETLQAYGYSMDECTKRTICFTKNCVGRPLPWLSQTAKPYLEQLKLTHNIKDGEMFISGCEGCPIVKDCKSTCYQVNDYVRRFKTEEPNLVYGDDLENHIIIDQSEDRANTFGHKDIPWDCLNIKKQQLVRKYLYEGKDFLTIAKEMNLKYQSRSKYEFYAALTKLSEYATIRDFLSENEQILLEDNPKYLNILQEIYINNLSIVELAKKEGISKQAISKTLTKIFNKYKINFVTFVKKVGTKVVYNVPELFK